MARGRFISESVAKDMRLNSLSVEAELVYLMAIPHLDRDGLIEGDTDVLYGTVCPKRRIFIDRMGEFIQEWVQVGLVVQYDTDEGSVLWFKGFTKNQVGLRYDRETPSKFPPPPSSGRDKAPAIPAPKPPPSNPDVTPSLSPVDSLRHIDGTLSEASDNGVAQWQVQDQVEVEVKGNECEANNAAAATKKPYVRNVSDFVKAYESIWGLMVSSQYISAEIQEWENAVTYEGWCYALKECADRRNQGHWNYLRPILERIKREGYQPKTEPVTKSMSVLDFSMEQVV